MELASSMFADPLMEEEMKLWYLVCGWFMLVSSAFSASPVERHAEMLLQHNVNLQSGEHLVLYCDPAATDLNESLYRQALRLGARVTILTHLPNQQEIELREASEDTLRWVSPVMQTAMETADALIIIDASENTRAEAGVDPTRLAARQERFGQLWAPAYSRFAAGELKLVYSQYPTAARAQEAGMGLLDYRDFVYRAMRLDEADPAAAWQQLCEQQVAAIALLAGGKELRLTGASIDLTMSIAGRTFVSDCMSDNFPSGEVFTSPVEDSTTGWVRFSYPLIFQGQAIEGVQLWLEDGRVTRFKAESGTDYLETVLELDEGSAAIGELGIGINSGIDRFTRNMLFDEKMGGTIHLALGAGILETGGTNESSIHLDMLIDMADGAIDVDGRRVYENGRFLLPSAVGKEPTDQ
jgi:aminopeptidase